MNYSISVWSHDETGKLQSIRVSLAAILAGFENIGKPVPHYLTKFMHDGVRYSFEDFDTLSSALRELRGLGVSERQLQFTVEN